MSNHLLERSDQTDHIPAAQSSTPLDVRWEMVMRARRAILHGDYETQAAIDRAAEALLKDIESDQTHAA